MARVVFLCPFRLSGDVYGGSRRILGLADAMARRGDEVTVESFVTPPEGLPALRRRGSGAWLRERCDFLGLAAVLGRVAITPRVLPVALAARVNRWRLSSRSDVAIYAYPWLWPAPRVRSERCIVDFHNCEADWFAPDIAQRPLSGFWRAFVRRAERRAWLEAPEVWCTSWRDSDRLTAIYGERRGLVQVVPIGAEPAARPSAERRRSARAHLGIADDALVGLFVGFRMRYNVEALRALAAAQAPRPESQRPIVLVVGNVASMLPPLPSNFRVVGYQADLEPWVAAADVALNPTVAGSGSNTKVPDLLAWGLPVVTTEFGLRGYEGHRSSLTVASLDAFDEAMARVAGTTTPFPEALCWNHIVERALGEGPQSASSSPAWTASPLPERS